MCVCCVYYIQSILYNIGVFPIHKFPEPYHFPSSSGWSCPLHYWNYFAASCTCRWGKMVPQLRNKIKVKHEAKKRRRAKLLHSKIARKRTALSFDPIGTNGTDGGAFKCIGKFSSTFFLVLFLFLFFLLDWNKSWVVAITWNGNDGLHFFNIIQYFIEDWNYLRVDIRIDDRGFVGIDLNFGHIKLLWCVWVR